MRSLCHRAKIQAILATQTPVLDPQCPHVLEEARYWCFTSAKRSERNLNRMEARAHANIQATGDTLGAMAAGFNMDVGPMASRMDASKMLQLAASSKSAEEKPEAKARSKKKAKAKAKAAVQPQHPQTWQEIQEAACAFASVCWRFFSEAMSLRRSSLRWRRFCWTCPRVGVVLVQKVQSRRRTGARPGGDPEAAGGRAPGEGEGFGRDQRRGEVIGEHF